MALYSLIVPMCH